jgi:hypothetical protein
MGNSIEKDDIQWRNTIFNGEFNRETQWRHCDMEKHRVKNGDIQWRHGGKQNEEIFNGDIDKTNGDMETYNLNGDMET